MGVKVGTTCLQWLQPIVYHSPAYSQTLASSILPSSCRSSCSDGGGVACRFVRKKDQSAVFGTHSTELRRSQSCEVPKSKVRTVKRACSASLDASSDEEFSKKIQELAMGFRLAGDDEDAVYLESEVVADSKDSHGFENLARYNSLREESFQSNNDVKFVNYQRNFPPSRLDSMEHPWRETRQEPPDWMARDNSIPASIDWKVNSVDLPRSLRIIKRKLKWEESFMEAGESAYCSVKKAFSLMVFIIQELHSYSFQMREILFCEDLQGILVRVQKEMQASFVWLFQQVFSHTPTLMVYVMILLVNFTVHSMASNAIAASAPIASHAPTLESVSVIEIQDELQQKFDSSAIKTFSVSSSSQKITSVGGSNGGGGKIQRIASGTDGDGHFDGSDLYRTILPDGASLLSSFPTTREAESISGQVTREEELSLWNSFVNEASRMQASLRDGSLDHETMQKFVSPVNAKIEIDDYSDYLRSEFLYQMSLSQEPNNPLLLVNYAQFLYLVAGEYDRAEEYFKRATKMDPPDAEAFDKYASFLWVVRKDLWAAEETYLEAIAADPTNSYYAANYAHFLWNTGGDDTCFPLNSPNCSPED